MTLIDKSICCIQLHCKDTNEHNPIEVGLQCTVEVTGYPDVMQCGQGQFGI